MSLTLILFKYQPQQPFDEIILELHKGPGTKIEFFRVLRIIQENDVTALRRVTGEYPTEYVARGTMRVAAFRHTQVAEDRRNQSAVTPMR